MKRHRILWLSHFVPFPPKGGCFQRSYNLIRRVGAVHELHLIALRPKSGTHPKEEVAEAEEELRRWCRTVEVIDISRNMNGFRLGARAARTVARGTPLTVSIFGSRRMRARVQDEVCATPFDLVHFDTISLAQYLPAVGQLPRVLTHHGAESFMIRRRIARERNVLLKMFFFAEWLALRRYERLMCPRFAANLVMSALDGRILAGIAPDAHFAVIPNGVDLDYYGPTTVRDSHTLVFAGRLDQYSNRDGILHFVRHVWPVLKRRYTDAVIHVLGHRPPDALVKLAEQDSSVHVPGFVPDIRPYFEDAAVAICPVRDGGGTRIKILDNLALGMPIVTTTVGLEGIEAVPGRDVLVADTPAEFVAQIGRVFDDEPLRHALARNGRALAEAVYSWDRIAKELLEVYDSVFHGSNSR